MRLQNIKKTFIHTFTRKESYFIGIISALLMGLLFFYFTNYESVRWNLGLTYFVFEIIFQVLLALFFGLNIALLWQKIKVNASGSKHAGGASALGSIFAVLVSGCPACGFTLASFVGLAGVFATLPLFGMELKIAGLLLLAYSNYYLAVNMFTCKTKNIKKLSKEPV